MSADIETLAVSVGEAGKMLGIAPSTARQYVREGTWPCPASLMKIGGKTKVSLPILRRFVNGEIYGNGRPVEHLPEVAS